MATIGFGKLEKRTLDGTFDGGKRRFVMGIFSGFVLEEFYFDAVIC